MTFVWFALGGVAALVVLVVVIGLFMPERYHGRSQVTYAKPAEEVWDALLDYDRHPMTGKMKKSARAQPSENEGAASEDDLPVWIEDMGRGERIRVKCVEATPPTRLVRDMASETVPMTSRWEYHLDPQGTSCTLTLEGETYIRRGAWQTPIFRVMMVLGGGVKKGLDIQMDMVADSLGVEAERR